MKRLRILICCLLMALGFCHKANAAGYLTSLSDGIIVTEYFLYGSGAITLFTSGLSNPDGCTTTARVHIPSNTAGLEGMKAAIMTAVETGKKIGFYSTGCDTIPFWGASAGSGPHISHIWIREP